MNSLRWCGLLLLALVFCSGCRDRGVIEDEKHTEKTLPLPSGPPAELLTTTGPDYADLKDRDPNELLADHLDGGNLSTAERLYVRTFLARHHPATASGIFARAWLYDYSGDFEGAWALYRHCIDKDPSLSACHQNEISSLTKALKDAPPEKLDEALVKAWEAMLAAIPDATVVSPGVFRTVYANLKDRDKAAAILKVEAQRHPDHFVFDMVLGDEAAAAEDHEGAERLYRAAAFERRGATPVAYRKLINHVYDHRTDRRLKPAQRLMPITREVLTHSTQGALPKRVAALQIFGESAYYRKAVGLGDEGLDMKTVDERTTEIVKIARGAS